jgi:hypothetical protein
MKGVNISCLLPNDQGSSGHYIGNYTILGKTGQITEPEAVTTQTRPVHATKLYYNDNNGTIMATVFCGTAWNKIFEVWQLRNTHVHGHNTATKVVAATKKKLLFLKMKLLHTWLNKVL